MPEVASPNPQKWSGLSIYTLDEKHDSSVESIKPSQHTDIRSFVSERSQNGYKVTARKQVKRVIIIAITDRIA